MSKHASDARTGASVSDVTGFESLQSATDARGPTETLEGHAETDHFALVYEDRAEQLAAVVPYIERGLERGERCMYLLADATREEVVAALREAGVDVDAALEAGQLSFHDAESMYVTDDGFEGAHVRETLRSAMEEALERFEGFRITAEETWLVGDEAVQDGFMASEAHVNDIFAGEEAMALCQYNRAELPPSVVEDVISTHPYLVYDGTACPNDYYTPPEEYFGPADTARENERKLETLVDRATARTSLERRKRYERELYEITADPDRSFEEKLDALFDLGCEWFDLDIGGLAKVDTDGDLFEVEAVSDDHDQLVPGARADLSTTYCRVATGHRSVESPSEPVAVTDPIEDGFGDERCYEEFGMRSYFGTHLEPEGTADRTLWFVSDSPREAGFSEAERTFLHLMGQWVEYELERRERERELRERTQHLTAIVDTAPACIKTVAEDGELLRMNPAGLEMVSADDADEVVGDSVYDLIAPADRERFRAFNERVCEGESGTLEYDIVGLDGSRRRMETHAAPLKRPDGTQVHVALTRDITEAVEREAELRRTKHRFETVFENSDDAMLLVDPGTDRFIDANATALEMLGYDRETLLAKGPSGLHPHEPERAGAFLDELAAEGKAWSEELSCRTAAGEEIPVEISASSFELKDRSVILAIVRDVRERKMHERYQRELYEITAAADLTFDEKIERLLELGRERFDLDMGGLNHLPAWDGEFRLERGVGIGIEDGQELWSNPQEGCYCRQTIGADEPVGMVDARDTDWTEDEVYQNFGMRSYLGASVSTGAAAYGTLWFGSTEPRDRPFSEAERSFIELMAQWVSYEVERRDHNESQRKLYEITADLDLEPDEKIQKLLEVGSDRLNLPVGAVTRKRESAFEIDHMHGSHPDIGEGDLTPPMTDNYCRQVVETGKSTHVGDAGAAGWEDDALYHEFGLECYAGTQVTVRGEIYGTVFFTNTSPREEFTEAEQAFIDLLGQCVGYEIERQQHEADLEETIRQLEQSNDRLKQFAYAASHDLQEPLRMVSSYLQLLENRYADELDADAQDYIEFAVDGADRMREMVDDLLAYARVEQQDGEFERVDSESVFERVREDLQVQIAENDAVVETGSLPAVVGDRDQLEQLFTNLVSNAIKYNESDTPRVEVDAERRADTWEFTVSDDGIGIDPEQEDRIFEVFKRLHTSEEYAGTGIGLSLCQEIVENHGGSIRFDSEPGDGTTFYVTLPTVPEHK